MVWLRGKPRGFSNQYFPNWGLSLISRGKFPSIRHIWEFQKVYVTLNLFFSYFPIFILNLYSKWISIERQNVLSLWCRPLRLCEWFPRNGHTVCKWGGQVPVRAFITGIIVHRCVHTVELTCVDSVIRVPCKHAISCQYRACTGPMLAASAQYRPGTGT